LAPSEIIVTRARIFCLVVCLLGLAYLPRAASAQPVVVTQKPCELVPGDGFCILLEGTEPVSVRSIRFDAPGAGRAIVSFRGSVDCVQGFPPATDRIMDLVTQIVTDANQVPQAQGPGGLRLRTILKNTPEHAMDIGYSAFNLASTRVVDIDAAGTRRFHFKIDPVLIEAGLACYVYNATFTVFFVPF
jgi:hypothetical protein